MLISLLLNYLIFNLVVGILFGIPAYFWKGKRVENWRVFLSLVLFPVIGWGLWRNERNHPKRSNSMKQVAAVFRSMGILHLFFIAFLLLLPANSAPSRQSHVGEGMEWANQQDNSTAVGIGIVTDLGIAAVEGGLAIFDGLTRLLIILGGGVVLVVVPLVISSVFEAIGTRRGQAGNE